MSPFTLKFLNQTWENDPGFAEVSRRVEKICESMSPIDAAYIGRDLLLRKAAVSNARFKLAAYLASGGIAGNDSFLAFSHCLALLPEDRFQRILSNPDNLIDDPISAEFDELYLVNLITNVFDQAMVGEDNCHILQDLVLGDSLDDEEDPIPHEEAEHLFPRLFESFQRGKKLFSIESEKPSSAPVRDSPSAGLKDFLPGP